MWITLPYFIPCRSHSSLTIEALSLCLYFDHEHPLFLVCISRNDPPHFPFFRTFSRLAHNCLSSSTSSFDNQGLGTDRYELHKLLL